VAFVVYFLCVILLNTIALTVAVGVFLRYRDIKRWNNGVCRESGRDWMLFRLDMSNNAWYTDLRGNDIYLKHYNPRKYE